VPTLTTRLRLPLTASRLIVSFLRLSASQRSLESSAAAQAGGFSSCRKGSSRDEFRM
jgi:hypothetical protein